MLRRRLLRPPAERSKAGEDRGTDGGGRSSLKLFTFTIFNTIYYHNKKTQSARDFVPFDRGATLLHDFKIIPYNFRYVFFLLAVKVGTF